MSVELRNTSNSNDDDYDGNNMVTSVKYLSGTVRFYGFGLFTSSSGKADLPAEKGISALIG
jgi:hypothetical protein